MGQAKPSPTIAYSPHSGSSYPGDGFSAPGRPHIHPGPRTGQTKTMANRERWSHSHASLDSNGHSQRSVSDLPRRARRVPSSAAAKRPARLAAGTKGPARFDAASHQVRASELLLDPSPTRRIAHRLEAASIRYVDGPARGRWQRVREAVLRTTWIASWRHRRTTSPQRIGRRWSATAVKKYVPPETYQRR